MSLADEIAVVYVMHGAQWTGPAMLRMYRAISESWTAAGFEPNRLAAGAPGVKRGYWGSFRHKRRYLDRADPLRVEHITLVQFADTKRNSEEEWTVYANMWAPRGWGMIGWLPAVIGPSSVGFADLFRQMTIEGKARYGYMFRRRMRRGASRYASGQYGDHHDHGELSMNGSWWLCERFAQGIETLLRDVYPINFLGRPILDAPFGKTAMSVREWIEDDPDSRGRLQPFTNSLTQWTVDPPLIPALRESLYRAGRVFHWRFFCPFHQDGRGRHEEPLYRPSPADPWEAPREICEVYRPDFYRGFDPAIVP